ncbi:GGDEF domain-containing protein [Colwellia ponticola]|uniref:GGDEF domain-containing protein n=1 Tax=Colwellia ponticola TaxID=2304625 RepID=UPI0014862CE9|nr:tetratricopeptide repeat-containing diguanylate cyclase [Colwellia ponticola]
MKTYLVFLLLFFISWHSYALIVEDSTVDHSIEKNIASALLLTNATQKKAQLLTLLNKQTVNVKQRLLLLDSITTHYYLQSNFNDALLFAQQAVTLAQDNYLPLAAANALKSVGIMHYLKADIDIAIDTYQEALSYYNTTANPILSANLLNNIALAYSKKNDWVAALEHFKMADAIYQEHGSTMDKIDVKYNMAGLYINLGLASNAIDILNEVIKERQLINDESGLFMAYADLVVALKINEQYAQAMSLSEKVITHYRAKKDNYNLSSALHNASDLYMKTLQPIKTKAYALEAMTLAKQVNHNDTYIGSLHTLSKAQLALGELDLALATIRTSDEHLKTLKNENLLTVNDGIESLLLMAQGEPLKAIALYQQFIVDTKKYNNENFNSQLSKFEANKLKQELLNLKDQKQLNALARENDRQFKNTLFTLMLCTIIIAFLLHRKIKDKQVKVFLEQQINIQTSELKKANKKLLAISYIDGLTKVNNRRCFDEDIQSLWNNKESSNNLCHMLIADIDYFKAYNDAYGHVAGDKALTKVAEVIKSNIRREDKIYRYGGEEFVILFSNCNAELAISTSQRILKKIENIEIKHANSSYNVITLSAGICTLNLSEVHSIEAFIEQADDKLYQAKERGRNQLCYL